MSGGCDRDPDDRSSYSIQTTTPPAVVVKGPSILVELKVGADCDSCPFRTGVKCTIFNTTLWSKLEITLGQPNITIFRKEDACIAGEGKLLSYKAYKEAESEASYRRGGPDDR